MFHLHIKAELSSPLCISEVNNKNIINMLSSSPFSSMHNSQGALRGPHYYRMKRNAYKERRNISQPKACLCYSGK